VYEKLEGTSSLQEAGSGDRLEACGEELSSFALITEADLSPLDRWPLISFGGVVVRFNAFDFEEGGQAGFNWKK